MNSTKIQLYMLLKSKNINESSIIRIEQLYGKEENLHVIKKIVDAIFFKDGKFSITNIKENMKNNQNINKLVLSFGNLIDLINLKKRNLDFCNGVICALFGKYYKDIKKNYQPFFDSIFNSQKNKKISAFVCIISFMMYLNKKKHLLIFDILNKEEEISKINKKYDSEIKFKIYTFIANYCKSLKIPIYYEFLKDNEEELKEDRLITSLKEILFYNDICLKGNNLYYKNFCTNLYLSIIDDNTIRDIRFKNSTNINEYIEEIFQIIISYFKECNFFEDYYMLLMLEDIYSSAFIYASENFNNNYLDFLICYFDKYKIEKTKFLNLFLLGLQKSGFSKTFNYLNLSEKSLIDIDDEKTMKDLIEKMVKKKGKKVIIFYKEILIKII